MGFHNPFLKDGLIKFPDNGSVVKHVEKWAKVRGDKLAYRFLDFSVERDGVARDLNWADFGMRNRAVAARLQQVTEPGDRVAILCPQNLNYVVAMYGTLYSGRIAVPLFDPSEPGHVGRLHAVLDDCQPSAILTTTEAAEGVRKFFRSRPAKERPRVIAVDAVPDEVGATWQQVDVDVETVAYLQYTSGSTRIPTGVQITHLNLATNIVQIIEALDGEEGDRGVAWLPFFHDMGLITAMLAPMIGHYFTFMTPAAFVRRPGRWLREMSRKPDDTGGVISVAPNFAFDHAAARGLPKDDEPPLDLSVVKCILNGSEPISAATVRRFNEAFTPHGFKPQAIKPSYGLAEATLFVSTTPIGEHPTIISVDRDALNNGTFIEVPDDAPSAVAQAGAGQVGVAEWAVIVDPETASELPDGQIGEVWISGQNMGTGYWGKPEETVDTFHNILKSRTNPSHAERATDDATWVRTGDLGAFHDGELYITGRIKGSGHHRRPQPLPAGPRILRAGSQPRRCAPDTSLRSRCPRTSCPTRCSTNTHAGLKRDPADTSEQLVIVGERAPGAHKLEMGPIADDIRAAIAVRHGVTVRDVLLTPAGAIPRTSSGKIGRRACRAAYLDGSLRSGKVANDFPD